MKKPLMDLDHAKLAARALSDLNMLYAIIALTENSLMHDCRAQEQQIAKICRRRTAWLLDKYDQHLAQITRVKP